MNSDREKDAPEDPVKLVIRSDVDRREAHRLVDICRFSTTISFTPTRASDELTGRMHCAIRSVAKQVLWAGEKLTEEEWKLLFVAGLYGQRVMPSPDGRGFVVLQKQTRGMSGPQKYDLTEYVYSFGAERGVIFDDNHQE